MTYVSPVRLSGVAEVTIRDLRHRGGEIIDRVAASGTPVTITRDGRPVASLVPLRQWPSTTEVLERFRGVPALDLAGLRADLDAVVDPDLERPPG